MDHRKTLGLHSSADADEIKKAYRKLAMEHHPDRGGDTNKFQEIQYAYMELERSGFAPYSTPRPQPQTSRPSPGWAKPESPSGTWRDRRGDKIDDIFDDFKKYGRNSRATRDYASVQPDGEIVVGVTLRQAFSGFNMQINKRVNAYLSGPSLSQVYVNIPPGIPDGYRGSYTASDGSRHTVILNIDSGEYALRGFNDANNLFSAGLEIGDIELTLEVDALDLITGTWLTVTDFLGEELKVRVPAGFNPLQRLKVANKGYAGWLDREQKPAPYRRDMYIKLNPVFKKPEDIDRQKIVNLYNSIGGNDESEPT